MLRLWKSQGLATKESKQKRASDSPMKASSKDRLLVPFPSFEERFPERRSEQESPLSSPNGEMTSDPTLSPQAMATSPKLATSPSHDTSDKRSQSSHFMPSPQSVIATGENALSPKGPPRSPLLSRQSSGWNPFASDVSNGGSQEGTPRELNRKQSTSMSPSSRRSLFTKFPSEGQLLISHDLSVNDCISIMSDKGSEKKGVDFLSTYVKLYSQLMIYQTRSTFLHSVGVRRQHLPRSRIDGFSKRITLLL